MIYPYTIPENIKGILRRNPSVFAASGKKQKYLNTPVSFDIETTSFYENGNKYATMYAWAFDIFDVTIIGRTWDQFITMIYEIIDYYHTDENKRVLIYVHNLAFDFQFFRKYFEWKQVLAVNERKPLFAVSVDGIEFRCSYLLSGYKLSKVGEMLRNPIEKLYGELNYEYIRHSESELSINEIQYIIHDVKIVSEYIRECIQDESGICNIPLTQTGYVRRLCRHRTIYSKNSGGYRKFVRDLKLTPEEYKLAKRAFSGGFTHAGFRNVNQIKTQVASFDFTSSYPAVMLCEKYPVSSGMKVKLPISIDEFEKYLQEYLCVFEIELKNVQSIFPYENYLSRYKCYFEESEMKNVFNNGRVYQAGHIMTVMTSVDYEIMKKCYKFDIVGLREMYVYKAGFLPTSFIQTIIDLYKKKTTLKNVTGKEEEYNHAKANLNSLYGMCVTDIFRENSDYDVNKNEWDNEITKVLKRHENPEQVQKRIEEREEKIADAVIKENNKFNRFLFYLWGVFVTAYARRNLWTGILECKSDYIYSDTDSIKITNYQNHMEYIQKYNDWITNRIKAALRYHRIPESDAAPKTKDGKAKPIGVWDFEGVYTRFKTLGAKRYLYETQDGKLHLTNAGLSKTDGCAYIASQENPFEFYRHDMYIPPDHTGKQTHAYCDKEFTTVLTDYKGKTAIVHELSFVHLEKQDYRLGMNELLEFLKGNHRIDDAQ